MKFLQIDEEGFPMMNGLRLAEDYGSDLLKKISPLDEQGKVFCIRNPDEKIFIESFDEPYVARQIHKKNDGWYIQIPYSLEFKFDPKTLSLDEWDRFHGKTDSNIPFVLSRNAQNEFFNLLDSFDDDSITIDGNNLSIPTYFKNINDLKNNSFWNEMYQTHDQNPPWNMNQAHPALQYIIPQLKIPKSRVLVLGCGNGHDAAYFASLGHVVTAIDFSDDAISNAKKLYGNIANLEFLKMDAFQLPDKFNGAFDIIFEHTFYCAVEPSKRNEIVKIWKNCLNDLGHLLGIFFVHHSTNNIPYGGSEWELRERLKSRFQFLFWTRWQGNTTRAPAQEMVVYAKKR